MKNLKTIILTTILAVGSILTAMAQEQPTATDPKQLFDKNASMVTLQLKDNSRLRVNLIYNDGTKLYHKNGKSPNVATIPLSNVSTIIYSDGSEESIYNGSTLSNTFSATSAAVASLYNVNNGINEDENVIQESNEEGETRIIFDPVNSKRSHFIDVMIDGKYATSIDRETGTVLIAESGDYYVEYNLLGKENLQTDIKVEAKANNTYNVDIPDKIRGRNIRNMTPRVEQKTGLSVDNPSNYHVVTLGEREGWSKSIHPFNHGQIQFNFLPPIQLLPEGGTFLYTLGLKLSTDFSIGNAKGLYIGFSEDLSYSTFSVIEESYNFLYGYNVYDEVEYELVTLNMGPTLTYYLMNGKHFVPFAGIRVPFKAKRIDYDIETSFGFDFRIGSHLYLTKGFGITSEITTDFAGNTLFHSGFTFRIIPKKNANYRGTYWYDY